MPTEDTGVCAEKKAGRQRGVVTFGEQINATVLQFHDGDATVSEINNDIENTYKSALTDGNEIMEDETSLEALDGKTNLEEKSSTPLIRLSTVPDLPSKSKYMDPVTGREIPMASIPSTSRPLDASDEACGSKSSTGRRSSGRSSTLGCNSASPGMRSMFRRFSTNKLAPPPFLAERQDSVMPPADNPHCLRCPHCLHCPHCPMCLHSPPEEGPPCRHCPNSKCVLNTFGMGKMGCLDCPHCRKGNLEEFLSIDNHTSSESLYTNS